MFFLSRKLRRKVEEVEIIFHSSDSRLSHLYNARRFTNEKPLSSLQSFARVVKLVDTTDLKSVGRKLLYRFDSGLGHQQHQNF